MTNLEMLQFGIKHIAENHGFNADTDFEENGEVCIYGGCNVPTLADVKCLCDDLHIERGMIDTSEHGIDVWLSRFWYDTYAKKEYVKEEGMELWRRVC